MAVTEIGQPVIIEVVMEPTSVFVTFEWSVYRLDVTEPNSGRVNAKTANSVP